VKSAFEVLSQEERDQIHERTLHILATAGMRVDTTLGRDILRDAGADVDDGTGIVRFPMALVEQSLKQAPREFTLGARRPGWSHPMPAERPTLVVSGEAPFTLDRSTDEFRAAVHTDWAEGLKLIDALDDIGVYWSFVRGPFRGDTLADEVSYMADLQRGFSKHVQDSIEDAAAMPYQLEILGTIFGGRDEVARLHPFSFLLTPISPLIIEKNCADACLALRGWDIPVAIMPQPVAGATAPGSVAGVVLQSNCDVVGCICLLEAAEPGTPILYAPAPSTMNPRTGLLGGIGEADIANAASMEMARYYGLPSFGSGGGSNHYVPGMQSGYECALSALPALLARPDLFCGPGTLGNDTVWSAEQAVIDCEIFRICMRICEGIAVEDRLFGEVLEAVGPGGNFLAERSTRQMLHRGEFLLPELGWHDSRNAWETAGRPDIIDEARERVDELLSEHEVLPIDEDVDHELRRLVEKVRRT